VFPCEGEDKGQADMVHRQALLQALLAHQAKSAEVDGSVPEVPLAELPPASALCATPRKTPYRPELSAGTPSSGHRSLMMSPPPSR
jgi:hypothetical protein